jgi:hypothetical protein
VGESSYKAEIQLMSSNQAMLPHNLNEWSFSWLLQNYQLRKLQPAMYVPNELNFNLV